MTSPFLYGAATSAHQVEGNNVHNDWWAWERAGVGRRVPSGLASDQYRRYRDDFALAQSLGHTAHRLSLEWSRIEPVRGQWDEAALRHYRLVLEELRERGLASFVTLHHFTNPLWFAQRGGWERSDAVELFDRYVRLVVQRFGDVVDFWITFNEPMVFAAEAYFHGRWPPQKRSVRSGLRVIRVLSRAHRRAYRTIHLLLPRAHVGLAKHFIFFVPADAAQVGDRLVARLYSWWFNHRFLELTRGAHDFVGVNYYFTAAKRFRFSSPFFGTEPWSGPVSDLGWPLSPDGLERVLREAARYRLPLYVTENGLADAADTQRADFIRSHLRAVERAQQRGADVRGYLYWSLLDNFEWDLGFEPRFGLVAVDYRTQVRTVRPSAYVYKAIIEQAHGS